MYLYKRRRVWWVKYQVGGVVHRQSTHTQSKAEARAWAEAIDAARKAPTFEEAVEILRVIFTERPTTRTALGEAWGAYERIAQAVGKLSVTPKTIKDRRNHFEAFVRWTEKEAATVKTVEQVTGKVAVLYAQHLANSGVKTKTRKNTITDLSTVWRILEKVSGAIVNPWVNLTPQDTDGARGLAFTREQEAAILAAADKVGKDWRTICLIGRHTGLRYGDIAMLKWWEIKVEVGGRGRGVGGGGGRGRGVGGCGGGGMMIELEPSKTRRYGVEVVLPLVKEVADAIRRLPRRGDYLFPIHAEMYDQNGGKDIMKFREVLDAAGVKGEGYSFHSWRHTFRTRLAEGGVSTEMAMRLCGHTQEKTSRRYDHAEHLGELRAAIEAAR